MYTPEFASREQLAGVKPTVKGDLESLASMAHCLIHRDYFIDSDSHTTHQRLAEDNFRVYPRTFQEKAPPHLREVMTALLTYPRNDDVTIADFKTAIAADFPETQVIKSA